MTNKPLEPLLTLGASAGSHIMTQIVNRRMVKLFGNPKVIDDKELFAMSDLLGEYLTWHKALWKNDRSLYNGLKETHETIKRHKETVRHKVMMSEELTVERAIQILKSFRSCLEIANGYINYRSKDQVAAFKMMNDFMERTDALLVLIEMTEHKDSIWNKIK